MSFNDSTCSLHSDSETLNSNSSDYELPEKTSTIQWRPRRRRGVVENHISVILAVYGGLVTIALVATTFRLGNLRCSDPSQGIYSPAQDAIRYETKVFAENFVTKGPYMGSEETGLPSNETDKLWEDLYQYGVSRIDASSAARLPNQTTAIPTMPDQYVVELDVFHQLHCLNALRKTIYPERYKEDMDDFFLEDGTRNFTSTAAKHYDHCIDSIRQSIMCHGDIATVYWRWMPFRRQPLPRLEITHTCRNFEALQEWAKAHQLLDDDKVLQYRPAPEDTFRLSGGQ